MTRQTRENLNKLSKIVFGSSSKWQKLVQNGVQEPMEKDREVTVPDGRGGMKTKIFTDHKKVLKRYSVDEVAAMMMEILKSRMKDGYQPSEKFEGVKDGNSIDFLEGSIVSGGIDDMVPNLANVRMDSAVNKTGQP